MYISVLLNIHSNIIEHKKDLANITSIGGMELGELIGHYRSIHIEEIVNRSLGTLLEKFLQSTIKTLQTI